MANTLFALVRANLNALLITMWAPTTSFNFTMNTVKDIAKAIKFATFFYFTVLGVARDVQKINEFPYTCQRLHHKDLESYEDLWLDAGARKLYAACSDVIGRNGDMWDGARGGWAPNGNSYNLTSRRGSDHISVVDIDDWTGDGFHEPRKLEIAGGYEGAGGGSVLDLHGFTVTKLFDGGLQFHLINHRPPTDLFGRMLPDAAKVGANSTIEVFDLAYGTARLVHNRTIASSALVSPNNLMVDFDGNYLTTNDHDTKVDRFRRLAPILGGGNIARCTLESCSIIADAGLNFPNGIVADRQGVIFIVNSARASIDLYLSMKSQTPKLERVATLDVGFLCDNLSIDSNDDVWVSCTPKAAGLLKAAANPYHFSATTTVLRISKIGKTMYSGRASVDDQYEIRKIIEDKGTERWGGDVLPGPGIVVHDVRTGNMWMGSSTAPFITVCRPQ